MKRRSFVAFVSSVRVRLTLWYLAVIMFIMMLFGGSMYGTQMYLNTDAAESRLETQLYQETQKLEARYTQAILHGQPPTSQKITLSSQQEIVLLLSPEKSILDQRGPLPSSTAQQLIARAESGQATIDIAVANQPHQRGWYKGDNTYRVQITPILSKNSRIAILMVGLEKEYPVSLLTIWLFHGIGALLVAAIVGYWLAGKTLRPVKMITRMANEINATDLRRRLNLKHKDEFGELAATFDQMLARLEAAFRRQTQFTADASHELRTPLTIIDLEINRALTQVQRPEEFRQVLEQIHGENEQMTAIVNSLLMLARADTGQIALHKEEIDLSDITLASVERLLPLARQSQIALSTGKLPELLVEGDTHYLSRALTNLIENAIKYTSNVGTRVHVDLSCGAGQQGAIRVQDDGPGIAEEHIPYLFDRFYRVDRARTRGQKEPAKNASCDTEPGGTGLGLAIAQWIIQAHGGEIRVESEIGSGSVFEVRLPLCKKEPAKVTNR